MRRNQGRGSGNSRGREGQYGSENREEWRRWQAKLTKKRNDSEARMGAARGFKGWKRSSNSGAPSGNGLPRRAAWSRSSARAGLRSQMGNPCDTSPGVPRGRGVGGQLSLGGRPHVVQWRGGRRTSQRAASGEKSQHKSQHNAASQGWGNQNFVKEKTARKDGDG